MNKETQNVISNLLEKIERGDIPADIITNRLFEMVVEMNNKIETLSEKIIHLPDISRKISEIHSLHFPKDALEKEKKLTDKFLAEILLGIPRKRRK